MKVTITHIHTHTPILTLSLPRAHSYTHTHVHKHTQAHFQECVYYIPQIIEYNSMILCTVFNSCILCTVLHTLPSSCLVNSGFMSDTHRHYNVDAWLHAQTYMRLVAYSFFTLTGAFILVDIWLMMLDTHTHYRIDALLHAQTYMELMAYFFTLTGAFLLHACSVTWNLRTCSPV